VIGADEEGVGEEGRADEVGVDGVGMGEDGQADDPAVDVDVGFLKKKKKKNTHVSNSYAYWK
jgi:hypothetical protein